MHHDHSSMLLAQIRDMLNAHTMECVYSAPPPDPEMAMQARIRAALKLRRARSKYFDTDIFGEAAWDILLDLYLEGKAGKSVSITSACIASGAPPTTALRWIGVLHKRGIIEKYDDPKDQRRTYVALSPQAVMQIENLFQERLPVSAAPQLSLARS